MDINKKRLAQDTDIDNDIIPEENKDNTDKDIKETTPTPVIEIKKEEIKPIEPVQETPRPEQRNTVRYIDSGFTF